MALMLKLESKPSETRWRSFLSSSCSIIRHVFYADSHASPHIMIQDTYECSGVFWHPIIQVIINKMWFRNKNNDGVLNSQFLGGGIPLVTIAIVLTVVCITYLLSFQMVVTLHLG